MRRFQFGFWISVIALSIIPSSFARAQEGSGSRDPEYPPPVTSDKILPPAPEPIATPTPVDAVFDPAIPHAGQAQPGCACQGSGSFCEMFKSDHCFDGFVEPVTNPVYFMDPRARTRVRTVFINQQIPERSILGGGDFQVYAAQISVALSDRFSIIAQKDGYISLQADGLNENQEGWADIAAGVQYVLIRDVENQFLLSGGLTYECSQGAEEVFQGNGDGMWTFFATAGKEFGNAHLISTVGWHLPNNATDESQSLYYSLHLDYHLGYGIYALTEMNGIHYTRSGKRLPPAVTTEGGDLINLGAGNVAGNDFISWAWGATVVFSENIQAAAAYEIPITGRIDLMDNRVTATLSFIY